MPEPRKLRVFLCHSSHDKPFVRELYQRLRGKGWIDPWLDEEKLYPGQDWDLEIEKAVEATDAVIVFLSNNSVSKEGYIQRELRFVLRIADFKPEGTVFVIPLRLDDCPSPRRLSMWQYVDYFPENRKEWAYQRLLGSLKVRAGKLGISTVNPTEEQTRRVAEKTAKIEEREEKSKKEKQAREKTEAEERAQIATEQKAKKKHENGERKEAGERAKKAIEKPERKAKAKPVPITKQNLKSYGIVGIIVVLLIGLIYAGTNLFRNLSALEEPVPTEAIILPTNNNIVTSLSKTPQVSPTPSNANTPESPTAPPTFSIVSTMISDKDGMVMVYVPAGEFEMGSESGNENEKPLHVVYLDAYWMDRTEVTNEMFAFFVDETGYITDAEKARSSSVFHDGYWEPVKGADWQHPQGLDSSLSGLSNHPVVHVSWNDSQAYCEWRGDGTRLPTEAEWEKAAGWDDDKKEKRIYPWGDNSPTADLSNFNDNIGDTTEVGSYPLGASFYGLLDMAGNVWEWVMDWYDSNYYSDSPPRNPQGPSTGSSRVERGGSWNVPSDDRIRSTLRVRGDPTDTSSQSGFRCARSQ